MDRLEQYLDELEDDAYEKELLYQRLEDEEELDEDLLDDFYLYDEETGTLPPVLLSIERANNSTAGPVTVKLHTQNTVSSAV